MTTQNIFEGIKHIVHISSAYGKHCEHCHELVTTEHLGLHEHFAPSVNHYLEEHGYKLLHIGSEASEDKDDNPCHHTIAVVGK